MYNSSNLNVSLFLRGIPFRDLSFLMDFIYQGEINMPEEHFESFMTVAEDLKIKGLGFEKHQGNPNNISLLMTYTNG